MEASVWDICQFYLDDSFDLKGVVKLKETSRWDRQPTSSSSSWGTSTLMRKQVFLCRSWLTRDSFGGRESFVSPPPPRRRRRRRQAIHSIPHLHPTAEVARIVSLAHQMVTTWYDCRKGGGGFLVVMGCIGSWINEGHFHNYMHYFRGVYE